MSSLASFTDPKVYHILAYGTLLGSTFFQSFIAGPMAFKAIPRPTFAQLQTAVTPVFFGIQTVLPVILALTWPGEKLAAVGSSDVRRDVGVLGLLQNNNVWTALVPIGVMLVTAVVNLAILGPATTKTMKQRKHQETRDGKKFHDPGPKSQEMQQLNSKFAKLHGASASSNLLGLLAMIYYGAGLGSRI